MCFAGSSNGSPTFCFASLHRTSEDRESTLMILLVGIGVCEVYYIAGSSNGRTQLSESCYLGSSPSPAALRRFVFLEVRPR